MRRLFIVIVLIFSFSSLFSQAKIEVDDAKKNFGFVKKGEVVKLEYTIRNVGNEPLLITSVEIGCSCTTVDYPKQPIPPNKSEKVIINFDTKTVYDRQDRVVFLKSNDQKGSIKLRYKGVVLSK
ncbi:MAG: DUF1573 domain-containing protein [Bacteroidota bacterium]|nr:DUF1573 domain-containing protein [Bacteroidota bacterium]